MAPSWCRDDSAAMSAPPQRCSQRKTKSNEGRRGVKGNLNPQPTGVRVSSLFLPVFAKICYERHTREHLDRTRTNKRTFWVGLDAGFRPCFGTADTCDTVTGGFSNSPLGFFLGLSFNKSLVSPTPESPVVRSGPDIESQTPRKPSQVSFNLQPPLPWNEFQPEPYLVGLILCI